jgi:hypothetical protein
MAIGCIQAQRCHTNRCPTGVATQNRWLTGGLDPTLKSVRLANYVRTLRRELVRLARACGELHPALVDLDRFMLVDRAQEGRSASDVFGYEKGLATLSDRLRSELLTVMAAKDSVPRSGSDRLHS